jgi:hypothetical protein
VLHFISPLLLAIVIAPIQSRVNYDGLSSRYLRSIHASSHYIDCRISVKIVISFLLGIKTRPSYLGVDKKKTSDYDRKSSMGSYVTS